MPIYTRRPTVWQCLDERETLAALNELYLHELVVEKDKTLLVARARDLGLRWEDIAVELRVTKQTVWTKWRSIPPLSQLLSDRGPKPPK